MIESARRSVQKIGRGNCIYTNSGCEPEGTGLRARLWDEIAGQVEVRYAVFVFPALKGEDDVISPNKHSATGVAWPEQASGLAFCTTRLD